MSENMSQEIVIFMVVKHSRPALTNMNGRGHVSYASSILAEDKRADPWTKPIPSRLAMHLQLLRCLGPTSSTAYFAAQSFVSLRLFCRCFVFALPILSLINSDNLLLFILI